MVGVVTKVEVEVAALVLMKKMVIGMVMVATGDWLGKMVDVVVVNLMMRKGWVVELITVADLILVVVSWQLPHQRL